MRAARREKFIAAAQVAFYYGSYKLNEAMDLSRAERELLLAVAATEQSRVIERMETSLGLVWDIEDLVKGADPKAKKKTKPEKLSRKIRIPALLALAPEAFQALIKEYRSLYASALQHGENVPKGNTLVDMGTLSAEQARAFWKQLTPQLGQEPVKKTEK